MDALLESPGEHQDASTDELRAQLASTTAELQRMQRRLADGFSVDFNDFSYKPRYRDLAGAAGGRFIRALLDSRRDEYYTLLEHICTLDNRFRDISVLPNASTGIAPPHWENWWLPGLDACFLYGLIALKRPAIYLEVGSGNSTRFARKAIDDFGLSTRIISIDPNPTSLIDQICDEVIRLPCEDVPAATFDCLSAGDMLFIDNSHRSFQSSDVTVCFTEIMPNLAPGVIYGLHDIFLPWDYPADWETRFYNEQYLLATYLLGGAGGDQILLPGHYIYREPHFTALRNRLFVGARHIDWLTASFWMIRGDQVNR